MRSHLLRMCPKHLAQIYLSFCPTNHSFWSTFSAPLEQRTKKGHIASRASHCVIHVAPAASVLARLANGGLLEAWLNRLHAKVCAPPTQTCGNCLHAVGTYDCPKQHKHKHKHTHTHTERETLLPKSLMPGMLGVGNIFESCSCSSTLDLPPPAPTLPPGSRASDSPRSMAFLMALLVASLRFKRPLGPLGASGASDPGHQRR